MGGISYRPVIKPSITLYHSNYHNSIHWFSNSGSHRVCFLNRCSILRGKAQDLRRYSNSFIVMMQYTVTEGEATPDSHSVSVILGKIRAISDLIRTELPVAAGICVVLGQLLALGKLPGAAEALLGFLTGFFISGSLNISNDYFDLDVDRVNHPDRPLPSGRVSIPGLVILTALFTVAGLVAAMLLNPLALAVAAGIWLIGILYNWRLKEAGLPGNMIVALSVAMTFIAGGVSVGAATSPIVWLFGALAFIFDLSEEISSGAMDMEGDRLRSAKSLALMKGKQFAVHVSCLLYGLFILLSFLPYVLGWLGLTYLALVTATDLVVVYLVYRLVKSTTREEGRARLRQLYLTLILFVIGIIACRLF